MWRSVRRELVGASCRNKGPEAGLVQGVKNSEEAEVAGAEGARGPVGGELTGRSCKTSWATGQSLRMLTLQWSNCLPCPPLLGDRSKRFHLCEPQVPHLHNGSEVSHSTEVLGRQ